MNIRYEGLNGISIVNGEVVMKTSIGFITDTKPYAYQIINGEKKEITCIYQLADTTVSFSFPNGYNTNETLIIDPGPG